MTQRQCEIAAESYSGSLLAQAGYDSSNMALIRDAVDLVCSDLA